MGIKASGNKDVTGIGIGSKIHDIFVVGNGSIVFLIEVLKELVATFRAFPSAGNGEVVDKEAKYAVIVVGGLVEKAARISW